MNTGEHPHKRKNSFYYALKGIREAAFTQWNFRFHCVAVFWVAAAGIWLKLTAMEWAIILVCCGMVMVTELLNTAVEYITDKISPEWNEMAGKIKDLSAGAVLIAAFFAAMAGLVLMAPKALHQLNLIP